MKFLLLTLFAFLFVTACNSVHKTTNDIDIWRLDTTVNPTDSIFNDQYGRNVMVKYNSEKEKIYVAEYSGNKLNGKIEVYNGLAYPTIIGQMNQNKPAGVWLFIDKTKNVDSVKVIVGKEISIPDKNNFQFDTIKVIGGYSTFFLKKPKIWGVITDNSDNNLGLIEPENSKKNIKAHLTLNVDTFSRNQVDFEFGVGYLINSLKENYDSLKILSEGYFSNALGQYYQLEFSGFNNGRKLYIISSIFIDKNKMYTLLGISEFKDDKDYYLYSWIFKDASSSLSL